MSLDYEPARTRPESAPRTARVRPYLIEPSLQTHALYLVGCDETRGRGPDVQGRADPGPLGHAGPLRRRPRTSVEGMFDRAWDIIADQEPVEVVLRFAPTVAARVQEARWHPSQQVTVEAGRLAHVAGDGRRARSRSGSGSCSGATTWRSSRRRRSGTTSRPRMRRAAARYDGRG